MHVLDARKKKCFSETGFLLRQTMRSPNYGYIVGITNNIYNCNLQFMQYYCLMSISIAQCVLFSLFICCRWMKQKNQVFGRQVISKAQAKLYWAFPVRLKPADGLDRKRCKKKIENPWHCPLLRQATIPRNGGQIGQKQNIILY